MTIETSGAISGEQALAFAARMFHDQLGVFINFEETVPEPPVEQASELPFDPALLRRVDEFELSVRSANCLRHDNVVYVGDLVTRTEQQMMLTPNFGRKSLSEIKALLAGMGLELGMDISVWPPDNIEELARRIRRWIASCNVEPCPREKPGEQASPVPAAYIRGNSCQE